MWTIQIHLKNFDSRIGGAWHIPQEKRHRLGSILRLVSHPRPGRRAKLCHPPQPGRPQHSSMHQQRAGSITHCQVEVITHHHKTNTLPRQRGSQTLRRPPIGHQLLHRIHRANRIRRNQGNGIPHRPGTAGKGLQGFIAGEAPQLAGKIRARHHEGAGCRGGLLGAAAGSAAGGFRGVGSQPLGGLGPVVGYLPVGALRSETQRPGGRHRHHQCYHHHHAGCDTRLPLRVGHVRPGMDGDAAEQVGEAQGERQAEQRIEFVDVAEGRAGPVQESPHVAGEGCAEGPHPAQAEKGNAHQGDGDESPPVRHTAQG